MKTLRLALILLFFLAPLAAKAECTCRCLDGKMKPICSRIDEPRIKCPHAVCPIAHPALEAIQDPNKSVDCQERQIVNPYTGETETKTICN